MQFSLSLIALKALPVLILGGFTSVPGAIVGGLIIGVVESMAVGYIDLIPHPVSLFSAYYADLKINTGYKEGVGFLVLILILLLRPQGLLGSKGGDRA